MKSRLTWLETWFGRVRPNPQLTLILQVPPETPAEENRSWAMQKIGPSQCGDDGQVCGWPFLAQDMKPTGAAGSIRRQQVSR
jgi:hypothetical protein